MAADSISERAQVLLKTLIERYIRDGQPVGSKTLLEASRLPISPATVRNVMADLEERGLVIAPHTSAGRIPTDLGYRLFVDTLIHYPQPNGRALRAIESALDPDQSSQQLAQSTSFLLSGMTAQVGLVTVPRRNLLSLRQVEFLPLSDNRVLLILVINERDVQNRILYTERQYDEQELRQISNIINQRYAGLSLREVRSAVMSAMEADKDSIDRHMQSSLDLARQAFADDDVDGADYVLSGESQLIGSADNVDLDKLQGLFGAFAQKKDILHLIDRSLRAEGVQIFIGQESGYDVLDDFSVVTSPYRAVGDSIGVLAVIGPTRMNYEKVISTVDITAKILSAALSKI